MNPKRRTGLRTRQARVLGALAIACSLAGGAGAVPVRADSRPPSTGRFATLAEARDAGVISGSTLTDLRFGRKTRVIVELGDSVRAKAVTVAAAAGAATQARVAVATGAPSVSANPGDALGDGAAAAPQIDGNVLVQQLAASKRPVVEAAAGLTTDRRDYPNLAAFAASVTSEDDLLRLANTPGVVRLDPNVAHQASLGSSLPAIGQPAAVATGFTGAGTYVAVIDSGADLTRAAFGSCSAPGVPANCRVAEMPPDFTTDDDGITLVSDGAFDDPCGNLHGTNVSGIVAGTAPQTRLVVADVFEFVDANFSYVPSCTPGSFSIAWTDDILAAVDWIVGRKVAGVNIVAANLSLGGSTRHTAACADTHHVAQMLAVGIQPVIAAGNSARSSQFGSFLGDGVSSPACISGAVPVGAVDDVGTQAWFSQSGPFPNMIWGPGVSIDAAGVNGFSGTSMAAPHLAGAFAALSQGLPSSTLAGRLTLLKDSATSFANTNVSRAEKRLNMARMAQFLVDNVASPAVIAASSPLMISFDNSAATAGAGDVVAPGASNQRTMNYWVPHPGGTPAMISVSLSTGFIDVTVLDGTNPSTARIVARNRRGQSTVGPFMSNALVVFSSDSVVQGSATFQTISGSTPSNDNSGAPITLSGLTGSTTGATALATPAAPAAFARDLWYSYTAPSGGLLLFSTSGSNVDTELCVTNTATSTSDCVGDETALDAGSSSVAIRVTTGNVITIRVGVPFSGVDQGTINLTWRLNPERAAAVTVTAAPTPTRVAVAAAPVVAPPARSPAPRAAPTP